jgi:F-type H+-transporting ATPase subunit epsilon
MADTMQFDLVSPERALLSVAASAVRLPGSEGDLTAMPGHAPAITTLRPGVVSVTSAGGVQDFVVTGGFAEIGAAGTSVLAEQAVPKAEASRAMLDRVLAAAKAEQEIATGAVEKTLAAQRVNDVEDLIGRLGL